MKVQKHSENFKAMKPQAQLLLIGESFAPWTKKARWALEQCEIAYNYKEYTPTLSEPGLRWRMRQWKQPVSVPVLFVGRQVVRGSWEIADYANQTAGDRRLGDFRAIAPWNDLSEAALAQGRMKVLRRILGNDQALEEALPAFVPNPLRGPFRFVARDAVKRLDRKYAHLEKDDALRHALLRTREALTNSESGYLLGRFSYADITMAVVLEAIAPIAVTHPPLGPATQQCWNDPVLAEEFKDLLDWRDQMAGMDGTSYSQFIHRNLINA